MNYTEALEKFKALKLDTSELEKRITAYLELDQAMTRARRELAALRPGAADFQAELTRLSGLVNALDTARAGALDDIEDAIEALKTRALKSGAPGMPQLVKRIHDLDRRAVELLFELRAALLERDALTQQADDQYGILAEFARERDENPGGISWAMPGGERWPGAFKALEAYTRRFISMAAAGAPEDGQDHLQWFSRRRW